MRSTVSQHASVLETVLYLAVGILLIVAAVATVIQAGGALWSGISGGSSGDAVLHALDQLLLVLMLVEILHTVRISIRTQKLTMVPFLVVGMIASIRRILVITMQAARLTEHGKATGGDQEIVFRNSMIELGVLAVLILVFVFSIAHLRPVAPGKHSSPEE